MSKRNRVILLLISVLLVMFVLLSVSFTVHKASHMCCGSEECTLCLQITECEKTLKSIAAVGAMMLAITVYVCVINKCYKVVLQTLRFDSLITLKVKLSC